MSVEPVKKLKGVFLDQPLRLKRIRGVSFVAGTIPLRVRAPFTRLVVWPLSKPGWTVCAAVGSKRGQQQRLPFMVVVQSVGNPTNCNGITQRDDTFFEVDDRYFTMAVCCYRHLHWLKAIFSSGGRGDVRSRREETTLCFPQHGNWHLSVQGRPGKGHW